LSPPRSAHGTITAGSFEVSCKEEKGVGASEPLMGVQESTLLAIVDFDGGLMDGDEKEWMRS
jgi:hypothetical protein